MNRLTSMIATGLAATVFLTLSSLSAQESDTSRPNILFIHVDHLRLRRCAASARDDHRAAMLTVNPNAQCYFTDLSR